MVVLTGGGGGAVVAPRGGRGTRGDGCAWRGRGASVGDEGQGWGGGAA